MKKLILICSVILLFSACKKVETAAKQNQTDGIQNVADFDKVIAEINNSSSSSRSSKDAIRLSVETIKAMRNSINFDEKGRFRGFNNVGKLFTELNIEQHILLSEKLSGHSIILLDENAKL
ncbi:MAG: hypothetical protein IPL21_16040 [Saprospirales bacterium]|nr:hypothetical protein [Saprospirales bacterium]